MAKRSSSRLSNGPTRLRATRRGARSCPTRASGPKARCRSTANECSGAASTRSSIPKTRELPSTPNGRIDSARKEQTMSEVTDAPAASAANANSAPSAHGQLIWYELMTADAEASKAFYDSVVGWNIGEPVDEF